MKPSEILSLSALSVFALVAASSAHAAGGFKEVGATGSLNLQADLIKIQNEELSFLSEDDPFPNASIPAIDPISKKKVDQVLVGPAFHVRAWGADFDSYRYVTFYKIQYRKVRIYELPILHEECHDKSEVFGSYTYSHSYTTTLHAGISYEGLGLDSTFADTRTFTTSRNLRATGDVVADHTPYYLKQDWIGKTYIQTYTKKTGKVEVLAKPKTATPWYLNIIFPLLAQRAYPYDFEADDADWSMSVERTIVGQCSSTGFAGYRSTGENLNYLNYKH